MINTLSLNGKRTLVTGAGTGIGREVALEFARQGADVVLHYAHSDEGAKSAVEEILGMGRRSTAIGADFRVVDEVVRLGDEAIGFLGGIDCLVNNAGVTFNKPFLKVTQEQFDLAYQVNVRGQFFLTQRIIEEMLTHGGGTICNITSVHGIAGAPEHSVYAGTKGAIIAYTRSLATEMAHKGIRVNAIAPGMVVVENYNKVEGFSAEIARDTAWEKIPAARYGLPIDVAKLAVFLSSDDSSFIIGQTIVADGGTTALMSLISDFRTESTTSLGKDYVPGIG
jgi:NAD(P)-dependent dehydrogenase (short-subunit alcohol dehydrogenase family)